jgi:hypothetical protein
MGGMDFGRGPLLGVLALSAVLRILILSFDGLLWYDNPVNGHAYALVVFTVVDLVLMGVVVAGRGYRTVFIWAILQTLALALNPLTAFTLNITPADFASYLFGLTPIESTSSFSCPFLCPPFRYSYTALLIIQIAMAATAIAAARTSRK